MFLLVVIVISAGAQSNSLVRGIYETFDEFKAGRPSILDTFYIDSVERYRNKWMGTYSLIPRFSPYGKAIKRIWGYCDGNQNFIHFQSDYYPVEVEDGDITFEGTGVFNSSGIVSAGVLTGGIGAGLYSLAAVEIAKDQRIKYVINPENGDIHSAKDLENAFYSFKVRKLVLYRGTRKEIKESMVFSVNDWIIDSFLPGSYLELEFSPDIGHLEICFGENFKECQVILFNDLIQYVECVYTKPVQNSMYKFIAVNQADGEYHSVWSYDIQTRRDKKQQRLGAINNELNRASE
jgi:hypothetical protein